MKYAYKIKKIYHSDILILKKSKIVFISIERLNDKYMPDSVKLFTIYLYFFLV